MKTWTWVDWLNLYTCVVGTVALVWTLVREASR